MSNIDPRRAFSDTILPKLQNRRKSPNSAERYLDTTKSENTSNMRLFHRRHNESATLARENTTAAATLPTAPWPELTTLPTQRRACKWFVEHCKAFRDSKKVPAFLRLQASSVAPAVTTSINIDGDTKSISALQSTDSSSVTTTTDDSDDADDDEPDQAQWWGPVPHIKEYRIRQLVLRLVGDRFGYQCWVHDAKQGAFNQVFILQFRDETKICLKIPATGWAKRWTSEHATNLRREALTLRYMHQQLGDSFPSPDLLSYDITLDNEIEAPFILMTFLPGRSGSRAWFDHKKDSFGNWNDYELDLVREKMLRSLAEHMAKLRVITFSETGVLDFDNDDCSNPHVLPEMRSCTNFSKKQDHSNPYPSTWKQVRKFTTTRELFDDMWAQVKLDDDDECDQAREKMLAQVSFCLPKSFDASIEGVSSWSRKETFSIAHDDLDLQNILVDEDGNVTGILDWDNATIRPHFLGWATVPMWIRGDCNHGAPWPTNSRMRSSPVMLQYWRTKYSMAMDKALGHDDDNLTEDEKARLVQNYTVMSHFGQALFNGLRRATAVYPDRRQLRYIADVIIQMIIPTTPLHCTYEVLGDLKPDKKFKYKMLPEQDDGHYHLGLWIRDRLSWILLHGRPQEWQWTEMVLKRMAKLAGPEDEDHTEDETISVFTARDGMVVRQPASTADRGGATDDEEHAKTEPVQTRRGSVCSSDSSVPSHSSSDGGLHNNSSGSSMSSAPSSPVLDVATIARFDVDIADPSPASVQLSPNLQCPSDCVSAATDLQLDSSVLGTHLALSRNLPSNDLPQTSALPATHPPPALPVGQVTQPPPPSYTIAIQHPPISLVNPPQQTPHQHGALPPLYNVLPQPAQPLYRSPGCMNLVEIFDMQSDAAQAQDLADGRRRHSFYG